MQNTQGVPERSAGDTGSNSAGFSQEDSAPSTELTDFQPISIRRKPARYQTADNSLSRGGLSRISSLKFELLKEGVFICEIEPRNQHPGESPDVVFIAAGRKPSGESAASIHRTARAVPLKKEQNRVAPGALCCRCSATESKA